MYSSLTGVPNNKYDWNFIVWLFDAIERNKISRCVQVGLDSGYLSSLLISRSIFSEFDYLGIGKSPENFKDWLEKFHFCDDVRNVEGIAKAAYFIISSSSPVIMICEISDAFVMYNALLRPGDIMLTTAKWGGQDILDVSGWELHIKR